MGISVVGVLGMLDSMVSQSLNSGNAPVLLTLGDFQFSLNTAIFREMQRSTSYRWASIEQFGTYSAKQFTGMGEDEITLPCFVYPDWLQNAASTDILRAMGEAGQPYRVMVLVTNGAVNAGFWCIDNVRETKSEFKSDGTYRKQEFTLTLKFYGPRLSN